MADDRTKEIRERLAEATPGPWEGDGPWWWEDDSCSLVVTAGKDRTIVAIEPAVNFVHQTDKSRANMALIANAPSDIDYLLGEVDRLKRQVLAEADRANVASEYLTEDRKTLNQISELAYMGGQSHEHIRRQILGVLDAAGHAWRRRKQGDSDG